MGVLLVLTLLSAGVVWCDALLSPSRGHIPFFIIRLRSALEADVNLGSLLPARCCVKAHMLTGSSSLSSSDSYIVIRSPRISRLWKFLIAFLFLVIGTVVVDEGLILSSCFCFGVGSFTAPLPQAPSLVSQKLYPFVVVSSIVVLLLTIFCVVPVGCVSEMVLIGVTMSWSSSVCTLLLLFDARRLFSASSPNLFLSRNLAIESQTFVSGFTTFE